MRIFDNSVDQIYEELKTLYPVWYRDVKEMDAILKTVGELLDTLQADMIQMLDNSIINRADAERLAELERWARIPTYNNRIIPEQRLMLRTFFFSTGHIGRRDIIQLVETFTSGDVSVQLMSESGTIFLDGQEQLDGSWTLSHRVKWLAVILITVKRDLADRFNLADAIWMLEKRIPAHLRIVFADTLNPIPFRTESLLQFRRFFNKATFSHSELYDFLPRKVVSRFYVNGFSINTVGLNGRHRLNGSWILNQLPAPTPRIETNFQRVSVRTRIKTQNKVTGGF